MMEKIFVRSVYKVSTFYVHRWSNEIDWIPLLSSIINTLEPRQNGRDFADDIFKCISLKESVWISIKI